MPIENTTGFPRINMLQEDGTEDQKVFVHKACLTQFLEKDGICPKQWDNYPLKCSRCQKRSLLHSLFQDFPNIESLPCLNEEACAESLDGIREDQPEEAEPFDQVWVGILQKDRPECSIQKVLELPMPSSFLLDSPAASSEGFPEDSPGGFPEDLLDYYNSEEDSDA